MKPLSLLLALAAFSTSLNPRVANAQQSGSTLANAAAGQFRCPVAVARVFPGTAGGAGNCTLEFYWNGKPWPLHRYRVQSGWPTSCGSQASAECNKIRDNLRYAN